MTPPQPLTLPDDSIFHALLADWPRYHASYVHPEAAWLDAAETLLRRCYPQASSEQLTFTARLVAPFALTGPGTA